jgi:hypothetical protein
MNIGSFLVLLIARSRVIRCVTLERFWPSQGPTPLATDGRDSLHQRQHFRHVVAVRFRDMDRKGNPLSFSDEVMFCPLFPAIRGVRPRLCPPSVALTDELSITAWLKSILLLSRNLDNNTLWIRFQTPTFCRYADTANNSCHFRTRALEATFPMGCRFSTRTVSLSGLAGDPLAFGQGTSFFEALGGQNIANLSPEIVRNQIFNFHALFAVEVSLSQIKFLRKSLC